MKLIHSSGREIELRETDNPAELRSQLMLLGMNGLAYTDIWMRLLKSWRSWRKRND